MPVLDSLKAALTDHLATLVTRMTLGASGGMRRAVMVERVALRSQSPLKSPR